jgi:AraC-like DNA-binding protein
MKRKRKSGRVARRARPDFRPPPPSRTIGGMSDAAPLLSAPQMPSCNGFVLEWRHPAPPLADLVEHIVGYRETRRGHVRMIETASLVVPLIISFGEPFQIGLGRAPGRDDRIGSFTAGLFSGHVVIDSFGASHCLQIDFTPLGAFRFFGLPMHELANSMVPLDDLPGSPYSKLAEQLAELPYWESRFDLAEAFVLERLRGGTPPCAAVAWAYSRILRSGGQARIGAIADELEWSRKHLADRFHNEVGLAPKSVARIARFNRALALARNGGAESWADVAAACGYSDQAHLVREFRDMAGATPATL